VVWRYELNLVKQHAEAAPAERRMPAAALLSFLLIGFVAGYLGFWGVPSQLDSAVPYETTVFGPTLFMFIFWIFINVHHYFIDNVIWRGENPDTRRYLFGR
jgi:heme A synthase